MTPFLDCHRGRNRFFPFAALSTLAVALVWIAAPLRAQFVYVPNFNSKNVSAYSIGAHGVLTPVPGSPFTAGSGADSVAVDPTGKFAYVANRGSDNVSAYQIDANGGLKPVTGSPFAAGSEPTSVAVDPMGKFVYVANQNSKSISAYHIDANGGLKPVTGSPFEAGSNPWALTVDTTGRFLYVTADKVLAYSIDADGALEPVPGSPFAAGGEPTSVAVDPRGKFVYASNQHPQLVTGNVFGYSIGANGALTPVPGSPFTNVFFDPFSLAIDPTGKFIYIANVQASTVSAASIDANGALKPFPGQPFSISTSPGNESMAVDPTGKFLYVADPFDNVVSAHRIGKDGTLTAVTGSPFPGGDQPYAVAVSPFVPFASSIAELKIQAVRFSLSESFTLGANSNGIDPVTEKVTLQIGTFSVTIPAGSFELNPDQTYSFQGVINGVGIGATVSKLGERSFKLDASFIGLHLSGITNPETVFLTIGIDSGSTAATVQF